MPNGEDLEARAGRRPLARPALPSVGLMGIVTLAGFLCGAGTTAALTRPWEGRAAHVEPRPAPKPSPRPAPTAPTAPTAQVEQPQVTVTSPPGSPLETARKLFWAAVDRQNRSRDLLAALPAGKALDAAAMPAHGRAVDAYRTLAVTTRKDSARAARLALQPVAQQALHDYLARQREEFEATSRLLKGEMEAHTPLPAAQRKAKLANAAARAAQANAHARKLLFAGTTPVDNGAEASP